MKEVDSLGNVKGYPAKYPKGRKNVQRQGPPTEVGDHELVKPVGKRKKRQNEQGSNGAPEDQVTLSGEFPSEEGVEQEKPYRTETQGYGPGGEAKLKKEDDGFSIS